MSSDLPLKDRILKAPSSFSLPQIPLLHRPEKYKRWTNVRMDRALDAVRLHGLSVRRAAEEYDVPKSTLHDRVSGRVLIGGQSGPQKYLTDEEEGELELFLTGCASVGYARSRQQVLQLVQEVMSNKGMPVTVTHGWWESFRRRHPQLTLRTAAPVSYARAMASDPAVISNYYDLLERTLVENNLLDKPAQIFNMDETGMPLDPSPPLVVAQRGQKHPSAVGSGDKSQITVLSCCSAAGYALPPFVIFDRMALKPELTTGEVPGTVYGLSRKGWIDGELFYLWFTRHFLAYAPSARPLLFLMDGHSSHYHPNVIQRAAEEGVIMFCLPPHTTHLTQPLDKGCFGPLKVHWRKECWSYITANPGRVVTRYQFSELFKRAWMKGMTMQNVVGAFRTTGVYPFDRSALSVNKEMKCRSLAERMGLQFIPLYSPARRKPDVQTTKVVRFSSDEIAKFQVRFEEGFDIPDVRYEQWVRMYHPESTPPHRSPIETDLSEYLPESTPPRGSPIELDVSEYLPESTPLRGSPIESDLSDYHPESTSRRSSTPPIDSITLSRSSVLAHLLAKQAPTVKYPQPERKFSARVLTSSENLLLLQEKEKAKREKATEKQRKKEQREERRLAIQEEKRNKVLERERKRIEKDNRGRGRGAGSVIKGVCLLALVKCVMSSAFHCLFLALQEHQSQGRKAVCPNRRLPLMEKSLWLQTIVSACVCHLSVHSKDGFQGFMQGGGGGGVTRDVSPPLPNLTLY